MPPVNLPRDDDPATDILNLDAFPPTGTPKYEKLASWEFYRSIGSPKNVVAPMVDQSELAWRILSRRHGADVVYTPMINSRRFTQSTSQPRGHYHDVDFWIAKDKDLQEEGSSTIPSTGHQDTDNPVIVQFCANDPDLLLQAARVVERYCNAVDLNLGCPQQIARRGHYGSFLQSDWQLIFRLINTLHINLRVPVTAKMRVFDCVERTVAYAKMLERAGAQIIAVHGRTREMKGHKTGIADWLKIRAVKEAVSVPVFANGNVLFHQDVQRALEATGADGVMSAEGNLYNPAIFANAPESPTELYPLVPTFPFPRIVTLAREYLDICEALHTPTAGSAIKAHFFRLARPALEVHRDLRPILGKASLDRSASGKQKFSALRAFVDRLAELLEADEKDEKYLTLIEQSKAAAPSIWKASPDQEPNYIPHWLAQPYYRKTMPPKDEDSQVAEERREKRKLRLQETAVGLTSINDLQALNDDEVSAKILQDAEGSAPVSSKRIKDLVQEAQSFKEQANQLFAEKQYEQAILTYSEALNCLPPRPKRSKEEGEEHESGDEKQSVLTSTTAKGKQRAVEESEHEKAARLLRAVVYANLAACHWKLEEYKETVVACNEALQDDAYYVKALHRRAQANEQIKTWSSLSSAMEDYKTIEGLSQCPASLRPSLRASIKRLQPEIDEVSAREKDEMLGKLKGVGDSVLGWFGLSTDNFQMQKGEGGGYSLNFVR